MRERGNLSEGVPIEQTGGRIRVILEEDQKLCPGLTINTPDNRIICTAYQLHQHGKRVVFISKDINARIKSDALGIVTEDFENQKVDYETLYAGYREVTVPSSVMIAFDVTLEVRLTMLPAEFGTAEPPVPRQLPAVLQEPSPLCHSYSTVWSLRPAMPPAALMALT